MGGRHAATTQILRKVHSQNRACEWLNSVDMHDKEPDGSLGWSLSVFERRQVVKYFHAMYARENGCDVILFERRISSTL